MDHENFFTLSKKFDIFHDSFHQFSKNFHESNHFLREKRALTSEAVCSSIILFIYSFYSLVTDRWRLQIV